jgi:hypothetical protein
MRIGSKYVPLTAYLRAQPPEVSSVTLMLAEVEVIIGAPLPRSAVTAGRSWWTNAPVQPQAQAWRSAGWTVASLWRGGGPPPLWTVTFTRVVSDTITPPRAPGRP